MIVNELPRKYEVQMTTYEAKAIVRALRWLQWAAPFSLSGDRQLTGPEVGGANNDWVNDLPKLRELHDVLSAL